MPGRRWSSTSLSPIPSTTLGPLWMRFWGLPRPAGPRAQLFSAVLHELGIEPEIETEARPAQLAHADLPEQVAFVRRRLCLDSSRDPDIAEALEDTPDRATTTAVVMAWQP